MAYLKWLTKAVFAHLRTRAPCVVLMRVASCARCRRPDHHCFHACRKRLLFTVSVCLTRACLGQINISRVYIVGSKQLKTAQNGAFGLHLEAVHEASELSPVPYQRPEQPPEQHRLLPPPHHHEPTCAHLRVKRFSVLQSGRPLF